MNTWWVSASERSEGGWHWNTFLNSNGVAYEWGGEDWIKSPQSCARIKRMRKGDIVVTYQAGEGVLGLALLSSDGYQEKTDGLFNVFDLCSSPKLRLKQTVPLDAIKSLPHSENNFEFLKMPMGTAFAVKKKGFDRLLGLLLAFNPNQAKQLSAFLKKSKVQVPYHPSA